MKPRKKKLMCECEDYKKHGHQCKHIYAVEVWRSANVSPDDLKLGSPEPRKTYPQLWSQYNEAQTHEKERFAHLLKDLCSDVPQPEQKRGRPRLPLSDVIFGAVMKTYTTFSGRRATSDLRECEAKGVMTTTPHYNTVFNYLDNEEITPILKRLIEESSRPLKSIECDFAIDSSGFSTSTYDRWYDAKYGHGKNMKKYLKAHLTCGVKTNIVTSVEITDSHVGDNTEFLPLLYGTAKNFHVREVSADKAYLTDKNLKAVKELGGTAYIPFKSNSVDRGSELWKKMYHLYKLKREEFSAHYHKRSNVETTFSMIKRKMGQSIRAKGHIAQVNEVLCKILAHNICCLVHSIYELNLQPTFWAEESVAQEMVA